jgi:hypothetical protein
MKQKEQSFQFDPQGAYIIHRSKFHRWFLLATLLFLSLSIWDSPQFMPVAILCLIYWVIGLKNSRDVIRINKKGFQSDAGFNFNWEQINSYYIHDNILYVDRGEEYGIGGTWLKLSPFKYSKEELRAAIEFYSGKQLWYYPIEEIKKEERKGTRSLFIQLGRVFS